MRMFVANIGIAILWMAVSGMWNAFSMGAALVLGALILSVMPVRPGAVRYGQRLYRISKLFLVFLREFTLSVYRVARLVITPKMKFQPGIFHYTTHLETDFEIALLANLITLTPGTLSVDVGEDRDTLLVHAVDCANPDAFRADIRDGFERLIREAFE